MSNWQRQIAQHLPEGLRQDPRKAAVLGGLLVVLGVVGVRQFALGGAGPASASAASNKAAPTGAGKAGGARQGSTPAQRAGAAAAGVELWLAQPIRPLERNLFALNTEAFPRVSRPGNVTNPAAGETVRAVQDELFWDRLAKSIATRADQKRQRQIRTENLQTAAGKLKVQSTIMGTSPRALIDGKMVRVGDSIVADPTGAALSFRILRVEARRIVIERDHTKLEVPMGAGVVRVLAEEE